MKWLASFFTEELPAPCDCRESLADVARLEHVVRSLAESNKGLSVHVKELLGEIDRLKGVIAGGSEYGA